VAEELGVTLDVVAVVNSDTDVKPWDVGAGIILVREAGGIVSEIDGGPAPMHAGSIIAAGAEIFEKARKLVAG